MESNPTPSATTDNVFATGVEEFKELNMELWIEFSVRQCLSTALTNSTQYIIAVDNLESCCVTKLDDVYKSEIQKMNEYSIQNVAVTNRELWTARNKFKELMKLIDRIRPQESVLEL